MNSDRGTESFVKCNRCGNTFCAVTKKKGAMVGQTCSLLLDADDVLQMLYSYSNRAGLYVAWDACHRDEC